MYTACWGAQIAPQDTNICKIHQLWGATSLFNKSLLNPITF